MINVSLIVCSESFDFLLTCGLLTQLLPLTNLFILITLKAGTVGNQNCVSTNVNMRGQCLWTFIFTELFGIQSLRHANEVMWCVYKFIFGWKFYEFRFRMVSCNQTEYEKDQVILQHTWCNIAPMSNNFIVTIWPIFLIFEE